MLATNLDLMHFVDYIPEDDAPVPPPRRSKAKTEQGDANCCQSEDRISLLERWRRLSIRQAISSQFSRFRKCFDGGCM